MAITVTPRFRPTRTERLKKEPKRAREGNDEKHLANIRLLPCCVCGNPPPNTVHHLKQTGQRGMGMRSPDRFGVPMCFMAGQNCHEQIERIGSKYELEWFRKRGIEALDLAGSLWANKHSLDAMRAILRAYRGA